MNGQVIQPPDWRQNGLFSARINHWRTVVLSVHMNVFEIRIVSAVCSSERSRAARSKACNSSFGIVNAFLGATLAFPSTKPSREETSSCSTNLPLRNATALKACWELWPNIWSSYLAGGFWKKQQGTVRFPSFARSWHLVSCYWYIRAARHPNSDLVNARFPSKSNEHGRWTDPIGSNIDEAKLRIRRWVSRFSTILFKPRLTTRVSVWVFHLRSNTGNSYSAGAFSSLETTVSESLRSRATWGTLLTNLISFKPPSLNRSTKSRQRCNAFSTESTESR